MLSPILVSQQHFRIIIFAHTALYFSMNAAAFLHGTFCPGTPSIVYITAPKDKFYQLSDRYTYFIQILFQTIVLLFPASKHACAFITIHYMRELSHGKAILETLSYSVENAAGAFVFARSYSPVL